MKPESASITVQGTYYWELIFQYDNSKNSGTIKDKYSLTTEKTVSSKTFISNKLNIDAGFKYNNKNSVSLNLDSYTAASEVGYDIHVELADELITNFESSEDKVKKKTIEKEYIVGPHSFLTLYALCYQSDGVFKRTTIVSTDPIDTKIVELNFTYKKTILGLEEILDLFCQTFPGKANKDEWRAIRNSIVEKKDQTEEECFKCFVDILSKTTPSRDNKKEWEDIGTTCKQILSSWDNTDKQLLLKKLLYRFEATKPGEDNKKEWEAIRTLSGEILKGLKQLQ